MKAECISMSYKDTYQFWLTDEYFDETVKKELQEDRKSVV